MKLLHWRTPWRRQPRIAADAAARAKAAGWRIDPADPRRSIREGFPRSGTGTVTITFIGSPHPAHTDAQSNPEP